MFASLLPEPPPGPFWCIHSDLAASTGGLRASPRSFREGTPIHTRAAGRPIPRATVRPQSATAVDRRKCLADNKTWFRAIRQHCVFIPLPQGGAAPVIGDRGRNVTSPAPANRAAKSEVDIFQIRSKCLVQTAHIVEKAVAERSPRSWARSGFAAADSKPAHPVFRSRSGRRRRRARFHRRCRRPRWDWRPAEFCRWRTRCLPAPPRPASSRASPAPASHRCSGSRPTRHRPLQCRDSPPPRNRGCGPAAGLALQRAAASSAESSSEPLSTTMISSNGRVCAARFGNKSSQKIAPVPGGNHCGHSCRGGGRHASPE